MEDLPLLTRTVPLAGRRRTVSAPAGDYSLSRYTRGRSFSDFAAFCRRHLRPADIMLDVGANIGLSSIVAADLLPQGRILAIEGSAQNCHALRVNVARHGLPAHVVHAAVGAASGSVAFHESSAFGHVVVEANMGPFQGAATPLRTIDELVASQWLPRVDFIKMDIEGFEQDALLGARETLARYDPLVFLEFNTWCLVASYDRSPRAFLGWLLDAFPQLYLWRGRRLVSVREMGAYRFLHEHITQHRGLDNLVAATASDRLRADPEGTAVGWLPVKWLPGLFGRAGSA